MARDTIVDRITHNAKRRTHDVALRYQRDGRWESLDWERYDRWCREFGAALIASGHQPGEAVAIMGNNRPEWVVADVGAMMARGVPAGIYATNTPKQAAYVAGHCEARIVVLENAAQWTKFDAQRANLPRIETIVLMREAQSVSDPRVVSFEAFCARGREHMEALSRRIEELREAELATLIYTSGTTGPPKGAMLSHRNLAFESDACMAANPAYPNDRAVSYLPLSHIAEQMITIHLAISAGYEVWFAESIDKLRETLLAARPTVLMGVPRVWEKLKTALETKFAEAHGVKKAILDWSRGVGVRAGHARIEQGAPRGLLGIEDAIARKLLFAKVAEQLGLDQLRLGVTGAAPIGRDVIEFFMSIGIVLREVYGQTEGTGASTYNRIAPGETKLGTVGKALPGVELKIADDGEILTRGDSVFMGYYKDEAATRATVIDGWLHTGDIGEVDDQGFLRITDRKKDLIITSGGKNVAPQNIEKLLRNIEGVAQAVVIGDRRKYLVALLTIDAEMVRALAPERGWPASREELVGHEHFLAHVQRGVDRANAQLARYESVKKFALLAHDFTQETGELTPTQKVRRKIVMEKFATQIEALYADES